MLSYLLKKFRLRQDLSLRRCAQLADLDPSYLFRLERHRRTRPSSSVLHKLAMSLQLTRRETDLLLIAAAHPILVSADNQLGPLLDFMVEDHTITPALLPVLAYMPRVARSNPVNWPECAHCLLRCSERFSPLEIPAQAAQ